MKLGTEPLGEGCTSRPARRGESSGLGEQDFIGESVRQRHTQKIYHKKRVFGLDVVRFSV